MQNPEKETLAAMGATHSPCKGGGRGGQAQREAGPSRYQGHVCSLFTSFLTPSDVAAASGCL